MLKLNKQQTALVDELLEAQDRKRASSRVADGHDAKFKELRDQVLPLFALPAEGPALVVAQTSDGRQIKCERKVIHKKSQPARDENRLEIAAVG